MDLQIRKATVCRPLRGLGTVEDLIPGLRSLRSLTPGYNLSPLRGWLSRTSASSVC
jgi:hypothetical protein